MTDDPKALQTDQSAIKNHPKTLPPVQVTIINVQMHLQTIQTAMKYDPKPLHTGQAAIKIKQRHCNWTRLL